MTNIKDMDVWVVEYSHPDLHDIHAVCSTREKAYESFLDDYARMCRKPDDNLEYCPCCWKDLKCLVYEEDCLMLEFALEDTRLNTSEKIVCFIYKTFIQ